MMKWVEKFMTKKRTSKTAARKTEAPATRRAGAKTPKCVVCGADVAPFSSEELCWVCRRLKISAWRDAENQAMIQE
jgi:hypothetical protein